MPGLGYGRTGIQPEGSNPDDQYIMSVVSMDEKFLDTMNIRLLEGRGYSEDIGTDAQESVILNAAAIRAMGWESGLGRTVTLGGAERSIIGIVDDFHFTNMRYEIEPLIMNYQEGANAFLSLKVNGNDLRSAMEKIEQTWRQVYPNHPFEYSFFTEEFENLFGDDEEFSTMLFQFTFIAIIVACLGLYGLASFSADQKTKEIGIRKVLGAPSTNIAMLVIKEYGLLIVAANLLAWPIMWLVLNS
jgi:putative ABC transport system permease protein